MAEYKEFDVKCPPGVKPGAKLDVTDSGFVYGFTVPQGTKPGEFFRVKIPIPKAPGGSISKSQSNKIFIKHIKDEITRTASAFYQKYPQNGSAAGHEKDGEKFAKAILKCCNLDRTQNHEELYDFDKSELDIVMGHTHLFPEYFKANTEERKYAESLNRYLILYTGKKRPAHVQSFDLLSNIHEYKSQPINVAIDNTPLGLYAGTFLNDSHMGTTRQMWELCAERIWNSLSHSFVKHFRNKVDGIIVMLDPSKQYAPAGTKPDLTTSVFYKSEATALKATATEPKQLLYVFYDPGVEGKTYLNNKTYKNLQEIKNTGQYKPIQFLDSTKKGLQNFFEESCKPKTWPDFTHPYGNVK